MKTEKALTILAFCGLICAAYGCTNDSNSRSGESVVVPDTCNCTGEQVCQDGVCVDPEDSDVQKPEDKDKTCESTCKAPNYCEDGVCKAPEQPDPPDPTDTCDESCLAPDYCEAGECITCTNPCGNQCCQDGQVCDSLNTICVDLCEDGREPCSGSCCAENELCGYYGCQEIVVCESNQTECPDPEHEGLAVCCDNKKEECDTATGQCIEVCKSGIICGDDCCDEGMECDTFDNKCKDACAGTRCGEKHDLCCPADELCLYQTCLKKGKECTSSNMCTFDEFCEESTMTCVNTDNVPSTCQVFPKFDTFKALQQWHWPVDLPGGAPSTDPDYIRVIVMPMAANLTDDNGDGKVDENDVPDVVFVAYSTSVGPDTQAPSVLRIISGDDAHEIASSAPRYWTYPIDAAIGDVDNDGYPDIVAGTDLHRVYYSTDYSTGEEGEYLEVLTVMPDTNSGTGYSLKTKYSIKIGNGQKLNCQSLADLDADGTPEIITNYGVASVVTGADGTKSLAWRQGCENKGIGVVHAADLDHDGVMELVSSSAIYDDHCNILVNGMSGGHAAIADLMPDSENALETGELVPEIALAINKLGDGAFEFWKVFKKDNGDGTFKWSVEKRWTAPIPIDKNRPQYISAQCPDSPNAKHMCNSGGGTPVVADFNGDTIPDVGVAARYYYIVYSNDGTPNGGKVLWADSKTQDYSSAGTGSSVFDFEGDGKAEVIYGDETKLHIYTGMGSGVDSDGDGYPDPVHLFEVPNYSATGLEYPIIVDVDNDGSTEIVIASDLQKNVTMGVRAFEDPGGQWVRTRRIWNQHHYHVTNINEDGSVPQSEEINWLHPKLNNYRQNVQPGGLFNAPNLVASALTSNQDKCSLEPKVLTLIAQIDNQGSLGVKAGVPVNFYADNVNGTNKKAFLGTATVPTMLLPGGSGMAKLDWDMTGVIEGDSTPSVIQLPADIFFVVDEPTEEKLLGEFVECIENDNTLAAVKIEGCPEDVN
ncbi:MAG: VCBS repeat-containing protein [Proteobacteria bacterium]|nr:VCBS repeat-containing protein [Pseudomonadota bacterium]